jgi:hypothetical protein
MATSRLRTSQPARSQSLCRWLETALCCAVGHRHGEAAPQPAGPGRAWIALCTAWLAAACAGPASAPPHNAARDTGEPTAIAPGHPLGWIGIAPRTTPEPGDWLPAGPQAVIVPLPTEGLATGALLSAIDAAGHVLHVTAGAPSKLPYGCDQHQLDVVALAGGRATPGPVWLLPPEVPASWQPRALEIGAPVAVGEASRRDAVGPLVLQLTRSDATHGTLAIARGGRTIYTAPIAREPMEGAPAEPLDFRHPGVAIPVPAAAWSLGAGGAILLALRVASYEGTHLTPILVEADRARELTAMAVYLYSCAF